MKKLSKLLLSRMVIVGFLIVLQAILLFVVIWKLNEYKIYFQIISILISMIAIIHIINKDEEPGFKVSWIILILLLPIMGGLLYALFGDNRMSKKFSKKVASISDEIDSFFEQNYIQKDETKDKLYRQEKEIFNQSYYISHITKMPLHENTTSTYFPLGDTMFPSMLESLKKAKHFIFLEYFIIEEGKMWDSILKILKQKVKEKVEVRVMFDDIGSVITLPNNYQKTLESYGIKCVVFNPFIPILSVMHNNRDHRKIMVIDGYIGYTGGINLADEYINAFEKHGHWKDSGLLLEGEAVRNLTLMFLESWNFYRKEDTNFEKFMPHYYHNEPFPSDGFLQPFGDSPLDFENIAENVYLNMINMAQDYIYINTPYLIPDYTLLTALKNAAKRGVDIRITTPHIPDKWYVHITTQSYYRSLIHAGVKIYEYTPGFLHAKSMVCDDKVAVIGTINLDYRSLYHHFECGVWLCQTKSLKAIRDDFLSTQKICLPVTEEFCNKIPFYKKIVAELIKILAPLM